MSDYHMFEVLEDDLVQHWVVARTEDEAEEEVREAADASGDLEACRISDDRMWPVTWVDELPSTEEVSEYEGLPGFVVDRSGSYAVVTATAGQWAKHFNRCAYTGCSES